MGGSPTNQFTNIISLTLQDQQYNNIIKTSYLK